MTDGAPVPERARAPIRRVPCVGAVVHDDQRRLLLTLRAHAPSAGRWSIPGGRVEPGEDPRDAVRREVLEETGLRVEIVRSLGVVELDGPAPLAHQQEAPTIRYVAEDFLCTVARATAAIPVAGDDAAAVAWVTREELDALDLVPDLAATLGQWGVLPR